MTQPAVSEPASALTPMVLPSYGFSTLADLMPAIGAHLGLPGCADRLGLPSSDRYVIAMVGALCSLVAQCHSTCSLSRVVARGRATTDSLCAQHHRNQPGQPWHRIAARPARIGRLHLPDTRDR